MTQWEYMATPTNIGEKQLGGHVGMLNRLGVEGWELVCQLKDDLIFKRPAERPIQTASEAMADDAFIREMYVVGIDPNDI